MRESSLDDFLGDDSEDGGDEIPSDDRADAVDPELPEGGTSEADVTDSPPEATAETNANDAASALTTYEWTPGGVDCAECGRTVERRWRDGDALVCADCKSW